MWARWFPNTLLLDIQSPLVFWQWDSSQMTDPHQTCHYNFFLTILNISIHFFQFPEIERRKFCWIGHTLRKSENEVCHSSLKWKPQGSRSWGCPKATCRRTVLKESEKKVFWRIDSWCQQPCEMEILCGRPIYVPDGIWRKCKVVSISDIKLLENYSFPSNYSHIKW